MRTHNTHSREFQEMRTQNTHSREFLSRERAHTHKHTLTHNSTSTRTYDTSGHTHTREFLSRDARARTRTHTHAQQHTYTHVRHKRTRTHHSYTHVRTYAPAHTHTHLAQARVWEPGLHTCSIRASANVHFCGFRLVAERSDARESHPGAKRGHARMIPLKRGKRG